MVEMEMLQILILVAIFSTLASASELNITFNLRYIRKIRDATTRNSFKYSSKIYRKTENMMKLMNNKRCSDVIPTDQVFTAQKVEDEDCDYNFSLTRIEPLKNRTTIRVLIRINFSFRIVNINKNDEMITLVKENGRKLDSVLTKLENLMGIHDSSFLQDSGLATIFDNITCAQDVDKVIGYTWHNSEANVEHSVIYPQEQPTVFDYASRFCYVKGWGPITLSSWDGTHVKCDPNSLELVEILCYRYFIEYIRNNVIWLSDKTLEESLEAILLRQAGNETSSLDAMAVSKGVLLLADVVIEKNRYDNLLLLKKFRQALEKVVRQYPLSGGDLEFRSNRLALMITDITKEATYANTLFIETTIRSEKRFGNKGGDGVIEINVYTTDTSSSNASSYTDVIIPMGEILKFVTPDKAILVNRIAIYVYRSTSLFPFTNDPVISPVYSVFIPGIKGITFLNDVKLIIMFASVVGEKSTLRCVFWNSQMNTKVAGWSSKGCDTILLENEDRVRCECDHFGSFALITTLAKVKETKDDGQEVGFQWHASTIACLISAILVVLTLITYTVFDHVIAEIPSEILKIICINLLCTDLMYVLNMYVVQMDLKSAEVKGTSFRCKIVAILLHYFLLASLSWMGADGYYLFKTLSDPKARKQSVVSSLITFASGLPLFIVIPITMMNFKANYGLIKEEICWLKYKVSIISFIIPISVISAFNVIIFSLAFKLIRRVTKTGGKATIRSTITFFKGGVILMVLLTLTWGFAFMSESLGDVVFVYLFITCNIIEGLFIFLFYCVYIDNARYHWVHMCRLVKSWARPVTTKPDQTHAETEDTPLSTGDIQLCEWPKTWPQTKLTNDPNKSSTSIY